MNSRPSFVDTIARAREASLRVLAPLQDVALLLLRLAVGLLFLSTGWGKVHHLDKVTAFFETLHVPAAGFNAVLVGYSELIGGSLIVIGLLTRFACVPLIVSMTVAILTAKLGEIHGLFDLVGADEFTYLIVLVAIAVLGPGSMALDRILVARLGLGSRASSAP